MSDDFYDLLKRVPDRFPPPDPVVTDRVADRLLQTFSSVRGASLGRLLMLAAALLVVGGTTGFGAGRWTSPSGTASDVSIGVRPDVVNVSAKTPVTVFGTVPTGRAGEAVAI